MIHFKTADGKITDHYHWMYSLINKVQNRDDKYLSSSYGEDVILTVGEFTDKPRQTTVRYVGTRSGEYLTMTCE